MPTATPILTIPEKLNKVAALVDGSVVERHKVTRAMVATLIARQNMCIVGEPGLGKSFQCRALVSHIDFADYGEDAYFETMITKASTPDALLGPYSLPELVLGKYVRNTHRRLPRAFIAFITEIWRANGATLDELLPITNERLFYNGDEDPHIPLASLFCDSNSIPSAGSDHKALWDRILMRMFVHDIEDDGNFEAMCRDRVARVAAGIGPIKVITWAEIEEAQRAVKAMPISNDVYEAVTTLRRTLAGKGILCSPRRYGECFSYIQACAFLAGRDEATIADMKLLGDILWDTPDQQPMVEKEVLELASPLDKQLMGMMEDVEDLANQIDEILRNSDNEHENNIVAVEIHGKLEQAAKDRRKLRDQAKADGHTSDLLEPLRLRILMLNRKLLTDVLTFPVAVVDDEED
jgi:MoxR-like ATPase